MGEPISLNTDNLLLEVKNLVTEFRVMGGTLRAVDQVSFNLKKGEILGVVGESGCGKSVTALSILRLIQQPPGRIAAGEIRFQGQDLLQLSEEEMQKIRGRAISMVFQEPMTSLNPVFTVGNQITEVIVLHQKASKREAEELAAAMLARVGIPDPGLRMKDYPHQLSGGMRQRAMIAMALSCQPQLLLADEPTTALDVTIQAQILELLRELQAQMNMSVILITHDLGIIAECTQRALVMYAGQIGEEAPVEELFRRPLYPYTVGLLKSLPRPQKGDTAKKERLFAIPGTVPNMLSLPGGCRFHPRCFMAEEICSREEPLLREIKQQHWARCWFAEKLLS